MPKRSINLIIHKQLDTTSVARLKKYLPISAAASIFIFISLFLGLIIYINTNLAAFKLRQVEATQIEKKIEAAADVEATYTITANLINKLSKILSSATNYTKVTSEIIELKSDDLNITSATTDSDGNISFSVTATSVTVLNEFVSTLIDKEEIDHKFSKIEAHGIVRDKDAKYILTINMKADKTLIQ